MANCELLKDTYEEFFPTNQKEKNVFGYIVGFKEAINGQLCYAWVQRGIKTKDSFSNYGVIQRSREFPSLEAAKKWAYKKLKDKKAKVNKAP